MRKTRLYLEESKTGWFSYRRRVPTKLVEILGKTEFGRSYNTNNRASAFREHDRYHREVEREIKEAETLLKSIPTAQEPKSKTPSKLFLDVYSELKAKGFLPTQMASSNVTMSEKERMAWAAMDTAWSEATVLHEYDAITSKEYHERMDSLNLSPSFKKFAEHRDWIRYLEQEEEWNGLPDKGKMQLKILKGDYTPPDATIEDVFDLYIDVQRRKVTNKERTQQQQKKVEQDTERLAKLVYSAHRDGKATLIDDLDETAIDQKFVGEYSRIDTRKRNYAAMSAAIQLWNKRQPKKKINDPFLNLKMELPKEDPDKIPRRVWHPEEFQHFWQSIQTEPDLSIKIMGMLMAYGGKPQSETARLTRYDVVLKEVPHINFEYAIQGKKRQKHRLPLVGVMLEVVEEYISTFSGGQDDLLFPNLDRMDSGSRSKAINKHTKEMHPIRNTVFEPYGLRHTFRPRYEEAGITTVNGMYLFGHKSDQTTATHEGYAKGLFKSKEFKQLSDDMEKVMAVTSWNYTYLVSDFD